MGPAVTESHGGCAHSRSSRHAASTAELSLASTVAVTKARHLSTGRGSALLLLATVTFRVRREALYRCLPGDDPVGLASARRMRSAFSASVIALRNCCASLASGHFWRPI